ncbi:MAG: flagellar basal body P-ring formation protein FlgA [Moraxellaceae bacterium]|nr:MAG: flagellar basal body P-ring formation protein FlgA [Moraxellaceae bacterium]
MNFRSLYRIFFFKPRLIKSAVSSYVIAISMAITCASVNVQAASENIAQLRHGVAHFLTDEYSKAGADKTDIKVGTLDSRLRLAQCDQPIEMASQDPTGNGGNISVQVACRGVSRWTILVPAQAIVFRPMAVAGRNLQRGEVIGESDVTVQSMDVSQYRQGFNTSAEQIIGKEVRYAITKGDAFRTSSLNAPLAIKRGDDVTVEAFAGSIRVVTNATAISDGRLGQQIRVKNTQSERIVNGKVIGPGKVQSML